jgi:uncharacterized membrane protein
VSWDTRSIVFALAALLWVALLVAAPVLPTAIAATMYGLGSFICHQISERSFHLAGAQLPVCARCIGIYAGFSAAAVGHVIPRMRFREGRSELRPSSARWIFAIAALPTVLTVALEQSGLWETTNLVRVIAGSTLGIGLALVVMSALATLHYSSCAPRRPTAPNQ